MSQATGALIVGEIDNGSLTQTTKELLNVGATVAAGLGQPVQAVLLGKDPSDYALDAVAHGAERVFLAGHPLLEESHIEAYLSALEQVCLDIKPSVLLIARSEVGRELGPRLAFRLGAGCTQDAVGLSIDPSSHQLLITRPVFGGVAMALVTMLTKPYIVTVRPTAFEAAAKNESLRGEVVNISVQIPDSVIKVRVVEKISRTSEGTRLEDARVVIAGGRGVDGPESFQELEKIATILGAAVGASRPACDAGWIDPTYQIGLTGKTVTPDLYIAVGISGACQHMAGCAGAKVIVAINKDPDADIFKYARYGVVGDWRKVLPAFSDAVRELSH